MGLGVLLPFYEWRSVQIWGLSEGGESTEVLVMIIKLSGHRIGVSHSTKPASTWHQGLWKFLCLYHNEATQMVESEGGKDIDFLPPSF